MSTLAPLWCQSRLRHLAVNAQAAARFCRVSRVQSRVVCCWQPAELGSPAVSAPCHPASWGALSMAKVPSPSAVLREYELRAAAHSQKTCFFCRPPISGPCRPGLLMTRTTVSYNVVRVWEAQCKPLCLCTQSCTMFAAHLFVLCVPMR